LISKTYPSCCHLFRPALASHGRHLGLPQSQWWYGSRRNVCKARLSRESRQLGSTVRVPGCLLTFGLRCRNGTVEGH
jgi:hypothetical protein